MIKVSIGEGISLDNLGGAVLSRDGRDYVFVQLGTSNLHPIYCPFNGAECDSKGIVECLGNMDEDLDKKSIGPRYDFCKPYQILIPEFRRIAIESQRS
ncbi:MAG: hypothetical protein KKF50_05150 [Nanoarchaeota archaeon]|nr:hypothetical protein [Nanoarchaeota archaeon]